MEATVSVCGTCRAPHLGAECENPRCYANPSVSDAVKAGWRVADAAAAAERVERERLSRLRAASFDGSWRS